MGICQKQTKAIKTQTDYYATLLLTVVGKDKLLFNEATNKNMK